jgi:transcriptional regulator GlxA family with amidase domain
MCIAADFEQDWSDVRGLVDGIGQRICVWDCLPFQTTLVPLWRRLFSEQSSIDLGSEMMIRADVQRLLVRLARSPIQQKVGFGARIQTLVSEMERTAFEFWSVDEAAEWVGVSRRQFTKLFRLETELSFVSVLTGFRLDRAKALLESGGYTAAGAAYAAGFGDVAHFYRAFKKHEGRTPGDWLRLSALRTDA